VILIDANLLIYARTESFAQHARARRWLDERLNGRWRWACRGREVLGGLLAAPGVQANLVQDAHLAALALEHGLILCSTDGDFARFPGLHWENSLLIAAEG